MIHDSLAHPFNIVIHVLCGSVALALGFVQLIGRKGGHQYRIVGQMFVTLLWTVVVTAAIGVTLFEFRAFLAVLTLLVAYQAYSGVRAVRIRHVGPSLQDAAASLAALLAAALFVFFLPRVRFPWVPAIIYSTLDTLMTIAVYDPSRFVFPRRWFARLWLTSTS